MAELKGRIVVPGEEISDKPERINYSYIDAGKTYSTVVGIFSEGRLVPLEGPYEPIPEDHVVGIIVEVRFGGYSIDLNCPYIAFLSSREMREKLEMGDAIYATVYSVDEVKNIEIGDVKRLPPGTLMKVSPVKIPRVIGKKNSMLSIMESATGCQIFAGRNGYIWIAGKGNSALAQKAIRMIEREAHTSGLTDRVAAFIKKEKSG